MTEYAHVSIPDDLWERAKKAYKTGKFEGHGLTSPSAIVADALRRRLDEVHA